jgi:4-amino-4-deoxy-L-arabinose transferase-like glycosyltransferase
VLQQITLPFKSAHRAAGVKPQPAPSRPWLLYLSVFSLTVLLSLWFNFGTQHINCINSCDASEYIRDANGLITALQSPPPVWLGAVIQCLGLEARGAVAPQFAGLGELVKGGPIFPAFIALSFIASGTHSDYAPVFFQCILSAIAAVLVAATAERAYTRQAGWIAGVIFALYPGFIVNTGRLYSESFGVFLFACVLYLAMREFEGKNSLRHLFWLGFALICLQLTRSTMTVLTLTMLPICWCQQPREQRLKGTLVLLAGMLSVLVPWAVLQQAALGKASLVVDRTGNYNYFIGNNQKGQGWLTFPYPDGANVEKKSLEYLTEKAVTDSPSKWAKLAFDKPVRLFKFPWNDWRVPIGPVSPSMQVMFHQLVLALCFLGIPLSFATIGDATPGTRQKAWQRGFLLGLLLMSLSYLSFITCPRYNLLAMPLVILFAAAAVSSLAQLSGQRMRQVGALSVTLIALFFVARLTMMPYIVAAGIKPALALILICSIKAVFLIASVAAAFALLQSLSGKQTVAKVLTVVLAIVVLPFVCLPLRAHGRAFEWKCPFTAAGQRIEQMIPLAPRSLAELSSRQCYLLIDGNGTRSLTPGCTIEVNGVKVDGPVIPGLDAVQDFSQLKRVSNGNIFFEGEYIFDCMSLLAGRSNSDLRQWLLVPVPAAAFAPTHGVLPSALHVVLQRTAADTNAVVDRQAAIFGSYRSGDSKDPVPTVNSYSWEKAFYGVENDNDLTDPRLDDWRTVAADRFVDRDLSPDSGKQSGAYSIHLLVPPRATGSEFKLLQRVQTPFVKQANGQSGSEVLQLPAYGPGDLWAVRISCPAVPKDTKLRVTIGSDKDGRQVIYSPRWFPRKVGVDHADSFDYCFLLAPGELPGKLNFLRVNYVSNGRDDAANTTEYDCQASAAMMLSIWRLPAKPLVPGYQVF